MANIVTLKESGVQGKVPQTTDLSLGELAINSYDGKLYLKKNDGTETIVEIGGSSSSYTESSVLTTSVNPAVDNTRYFMDTTSSALSITLPSGVENFKIFIHDVGGNFNTNNLTVYPNGSQTIMGVNDIFVLDIDNDSTELIYKNNDWRVLS